MSIRRQQKPAQKPVAPGPFIRNNEKKLVPSVTELNVQAAGLHKVQPFQSSGLNMVPQDFPNPQFFETQMLFSVRPIAKQP